MNRKELEKTRMDNFRKLDPAYRSNLNRIEYNPSESIEHFMTKTIGFVLLRNGIPAERLPEWFNWRKDNHELKSDKLDELTKLFSNVIKGYLIPDFMKEFKKHSWQRPQVITEARFKREINEPIGKMTDVKMKKGEIYIKGKFFPQRRVDIFILDTGEIVEIETTEKRAKRFDGDKSTIVVRI